MKNAIDIEFLKKIKRAENLRTLRKEIDKTWVNNKIKNHINRHPYLANFSVKQIKEMILNDDFIASFFIKEPGRQNISENAIAEYISNIAGVEDFVNHGSSVNLFVINGKITEKREPGIKSIDYTWNWNGRKVYASQKYTAENGGAQDNQYNDILSFLKNSQGNEEHIFIAIIDGDYYNNFRTKELKKFPNIELFGDVEDKGPILSFVMEGIHAHDLAQWLNEYKIAVRPGHMCAQPLLDNFHQEALVRASFMAYNTKEDVDKLVNALREISDKL